MYEEIIKKHLPYFENRTAKNWDAEVLLRDFAKDIEASNADGENRQVDADVIAQTKRDVMQRTKALEKIIRSLKDRLEPIIQAGYYWGEQAENKKWNPTHNYDLGAQTFIKIERFKFNKWLRTALRDYFAL